MCCLGDLKILYVAVFFFSSSHHTRNCVKDLKLGEFCTEKTKTAIKGKIRSKSDHVLCKGTGREIALNV